MATFAAPLEKCAKNSFEPIENGKDTSNDYNTNIDKKLMREHQKTNERAMFYKKPIKKNNHKLEVDFDDTPQEIRRQRILHQQKQNRDASFNSGRRTLETVLYPENEQDMEEELEEELEQEEMEVEQIKKNYRHKRSDYGRMLMLSEWMLEVPEDFADKWIMVPCPLGKRVIIVASKGMTKVYARNGVRLFLFKTMLPGGGPKTNQHHFTILDCIWSVDKKAYYVLDVLAWAQQEMLQCEAECRFYWIKSKLEEIPVLKTRDSINGYPILSLPYVNCDQDFYECLESLSSSLRMDGLLFFHKEAYYTSGKTPLVVWLKTYMLPEVLGMSVPEPYDEKPDSYINFEHHVFQVTQRERALAKKFKNKTSQKINKLEEECLVQECIEEKCIEGECIEEKCIE